MPKQKQKARTAGEPRQRRQPSPSSHNGGMRETVESVVIAFALAFLFKTFQAEAYVIPTGSMAPTLLGRHKELQCASCRIHFSIGASSEVEQNSGRLIKDRRIRSTLCPNCRRPLSATDAPVFNGDRIVVNKQVSKFRRFDVVVFKNPEEGHVNYIKRLVGLPGETIRIRQGNLWARTRDDDRWQILRKNDASVQKDIQLPVYYDQFPARDLLEAGCPERWASTGSSADPDVPDSWQETENAWTADRDARTFTADSSDNRWHWLRYRHFVPSVADWREVDNRREIPNVPQPSLISDYCGFNVSMQSFDSNAYWVGDLTLNCTIEVSSSSESSAIQFALVEGPDIFYCQIRLDNGTAELTRINHRTDRDGERPQTLATGKTPVHGSGTWRISFANVDNRLLLWVDGELVTFDGPSETDQNFVDALATLPGSADVAPCGIAVRGGKATVSELLLERDIYYRNDAYQFAPDDDSSEPGTAYELTARSQEVSNPSALHRELSYPEEWAERYISAATTAHDRYGRYTEYRLADDEYLMFGDNSPRSKDSRLFDFYNRPKWGIDSHRYAVKEKDLIGKALFIFWPHAVPFLNDGKGFSLRKHKDLDGNEIYDYPLYRFPFYPNVTRMKKIR